MCAMYPTTSEKRYAYLKFTCHVAVMAGKTEDAMSLEGINTISDILSKLDKECPGFKEVFMPTGGVFNSRTAITLRRVGLPTISIIDTEQKIEDGDVLCFW